MENLARAAKFRWHTERYDYGELVRYLHQFDNYPIPTKEEFNRLHREWKKTGDRKLYDRMYYGNVRLAAAVARKHFYSSRMSLVEMVQEGMMHGMRRAIQHYNPRKGGFANLAHLSVRNAIDNHIVRHGNQRPFRIPVGLTFKLRIVNRYYETFIHNSQRTPEPDELFRIILKGKDDVNRDEFNKCWSILHHSYSSFENDVKASFEAETIWPEEEAYTRERLREINGMFDQLQRAIPKLLPKEREIINFNFGDFDRRLNHTQISFVFGCTRQRVGQLENRAVEKLSEYIRLPAPTTAALLTMMGELGILEITELPTPRDPVPDERLFAILCEHHRRTPSGIQLVPAPLMVLQHRVKMTAAEADEALSRLRDQALVDGSPPWRELHIVPNVELPNYEREYLERQEKLRTRPQQRKNRFRKEAQ